MGTVSRNLRETATIWTKLGIDGNRNPTFDTPVLAKARWEQRDRTFFDVLGQEARGNSIVFLDRKVETGDYIARGDFTTTLNPQLIDDAHPIEGGAEVPNLRRTGSEFRALV